MNEDLRNKLSSGAITRADVLAILEWQLSLPAERMDCALISECDLYLAPDGPRLGKEREDALFARLLEHIAAGDALASVRAGLDETAEDPYDLDDVVEPIDAIAPVDDEDEQDDRSPYGPDDPYDLDDVLEPIEAEMPQDDEDALDEFSPYGPDDPYDLDDVVDQEQAQTPAPGRRAAAKQTRAKHRRPIRRLAIVALITALLLALAVGGVAYGYRRGVLNFTEDFGFAKMVSQEGADQFVSSGVLKHLSLEHVDVDVLEAAYDGAELRVVYALTSHDGELKLDPYMENGYIMPGSKEGEVHMCDYLRVNGQDAYFDNTWEMPGEAPGQMLYYLQTNLSQWGVDVSGAETLTLGLPLLARDDPDSRVQPTLDFTIPAEIPEGLVRTAEVTEADMDGLNVTVAEARFSPLNGYVQLRIEGLTQERFYAEFSTLCEVYAMDGSLLTSSHLAGTHFDDEGALIGVTMTPTEGEWPDQMIIALEFEDYSPDWEAVLTLSPAKE